MFVSDLSTSVDGSPFSIWMISPGKHVVVRGVEDKKTRLITAKKIEAIGNNSLVHRSGQAIEDRAPSLTKEGNEWRGTVYTDGYAIAVDPKTTVQVAQGITDINVFRPNLRVAYEAERQPDSSLLAKSINFTVDENFADEQKFRAENDFKIELPDYDHKQPGKVHFFLKTYQILPDRALQEAINNFGQNLVPQWQKNLPDSDPAKIHFRFFVLEKPSSLDRTVSNDTGTVLIPSQIIAKLQNEAQLATLLSADIAGALEKDTYRSRSHKHAQEAIDIALIADPFASKTISDAAFSAEYWTPLIEHECRVGLRNMIAAGYDPREAPIALQRISEKHPDSKSDKPLPPSASYVDAELGFDYMSTDFTALRKGESEFAALRNMTLTADPKLSKTEKSRLSD